MIFTLGAQRTFCRDHETKSQKVSWLWVLEAEFSLALVGGCLGLRPGRKMYTKQEYFLLNHLLRYWFPMCDLLRSCSGACLKYRMLVSTPSLLYQLPGSGAQDPAFSTGQFTDILKSLVDAGEIKKRWKEHREELFKKILMNWITMMVWSELDILECEVKWALGSTAVNKASGCDGIPVELFKTLKNDAIKVLHSICQQIWKTQEWPQDWKRSLLILIPKKGSTKESSNFQTLISHASKVMLKILHVRLQHYVNQELPDAQAGFRKGRGSRGSLEQIANIHWIIKKAKEFQKNIYLCFDYAKAFDCVDCNKLWKALREMGIPDHLTCLLRNLYAGQEATVRSLYGTTDWFKNEKGVRQGCLPLPCLFNLHAEHIMRNARLGEL